MHLSMTAWSLDMKKGGKTADDIPDIAAVTDGEDEMFTGTFITPED